ncbi:MAG: class II glutamine amidotransferase [Corynebacteriales bacterium]|nr:class II glutamine amidotransferase [Mycobacteriales bacterium]
MCRLFGLTSGDHPIRATFWLLDAPSSIREQSRRMPDGTGLGWFTQNGSIIRSRAPIPAYKYTEFEQEAQRISSTMFVAHIRYATTGHVEVRNTHPFEMDNRLFAHNGIIKGLDILRSWLTPDELKLVKGATDSELIFAFITAEINRLGDTTKGLTSAITRIGAELPVFALNILLAEKDKIWALRYPDTHELWVLPSTGEQFLRSDSGLMRVHARDGEDFPAVVIASEPLDHNPEWRLLDPGELLIAEGPATHSLFPFKDPAHPLTREDLDLHEVLAQEPATKDVVAGA